MPTFTELFAIHGLVSYDKQMSLSALVKERPNFSYGGGRLSFGDDLSFPIQLLGSQSEYDNTWLWAWANTGLSGWPLEGAQQLRDYGVAHSIPELTKSQFALRDFDGHYLTMVCAGILNADCYYRLPYEGGAAFLVVPSAPEVQALSDRSPHYMVGRITDFICLFPCSHRVSVEHYLTYKSYTFSSSGSELTARSPLNQTLRVCFDASGRVLEASARVAGSAIPEGGSTDAR
jgi:hypothetical protein